MGKKDIITKEYMEMTGMKIEKEAEDEKVNV